MDSSHHFLAGGGEMGERIRAMDWARTPLGPPELWPQSLRSALSFLLPSKAQIALFWGPELITLYNDAYRPVLGEKHPSALGMPIREAWDELWRAGLEKIFEDVRTTGEAFWARDRPFFMERHGYLEETYFDVSYDPVRDESGRVGGVFCIVSETTRRVVGERRLRALRDLSDALNQVTSVPDIYRAAAEVLGSYPEDIPFAWLYADVDGSAQLMGSCGIDPSQLAAPFDGRALRSSRSSVSGSVQIFEGEELLALGSLRAGPWPEPIHQLAVATLALPGQSAQGRWIVGISPRRRIDADYGDFIALAASSIAAGLAAARRSEDERRRAQLLTELDRAKTVFFSNVSHEFRTPLTLMLGPLEDALEDRAHPLPAAQVERLRIAHRSGRRLQKLVNALLDFSRIEAGRAQATYVATDLATFTAELASTFRSATDRAGLKLDVACSPLAEPAWVDREMWEQIVLNLLSNALKFTFEGEIAVSLREREGAIELAVRDTGTGIPRSELPHVFERFRRIEGARSRTHEGTGIGLALVSEFAKLHGGYVRVDSEEERGSTFTVTIPSGTSHLPRERIMHGSDCDPIVARPRSEAYVEEALGWLPEGTPQRALKSRPSAPSEPDRSRILLADDNADMREYVRRLLAPRYEVEVLADGESALAAARARRHDLVLADVMMPRLDGLGLTRALRADITTRSMQVILLSARSGPDARMEGMRAGADDYLEKPFSARELIARVGARLEIARLRQESEQNIRIIADHVPVWIVQCDSHARYTFVNAAYAARFDLTPEQVVGRHVEDVVGARAYASFRRYVEAALRGERVEFEAHIPYEALGQRWVHCVYVPQTNPTGAVTGFVSVIEDVTARRRAEEALREADRRKDEFIATLSHELRNPLAPLRNALQLLRMTKEPNEQTASIHEMMERQVHQLVRLVDDLLEISRINRGALELRRERIELAPVVRNAIETSEPLIQRSGHTLEIALPEQPIWIEGDSVRIGQILANLLNNAARYTEPNGRIWIRVTAQDSFVAISVRDTGSGFEPERAERLFDMFSRGERSTGLGIGLALARRLAEMHGGTLQGRSDGLGLGAEFTLRLPSCTQPEARPAADRHTSASMARKRILVVDDNRDAAESLQMLLELLNAEVRVAHDGREALELFARFEPAFVLLDIGMPGMNGYEVARALRNRFPDRRVTIVALTGWGQAEDRQRSVEAGFDHHLVKPADLDALQKLIDVPEESCRLAPAKA